MTVDRNGLDVLERQECLTLLGRATLGRVALTIGALPTILPVNYLLVDEHVVFRTGVGTKLDAAARGAVVAFEVDDADPLEHTGWSVVVTGIPQDRPVAPLAEPILATAVPRWAPWGDTRLLYLPTDLVSGRRLVHRPHDHDGTGTFVPGRGAGGL